MRGRETGQGDRREATFLDKTEQGTSFRPTADHRTVTTGTTHRAFPDEFPLVALLMTRSARVSDPISPAGSPTGGIAASSAFPTCAPPIKPRDRNQVCDQNVYARQPRWRSATPSSAEKTREPCSGDTSAGVHFVYDLRFRSDTTPVGITRSAAEQPIESEARNGTEPLDRPGVHSVNFRRPLLRQGTARERPGRIRRPCAPRALPPDPLRRRGAGPDSPDERSMPRNSGGSDGHGQRRTDGLRVSGANRPHRVRRAEGRRARAFRARLHRGHPAGRRPTG